MHILQLALDVLRQSFIVNLLQQGVRHADSATTPKRCNLASSAGTGFGGLQHQTSNVRPGYIAAAMLLLA